MNFDDMIKKAETQKICFLCSTCTHYHEGEDRELKGILDQQVCSKFACAGPIWGGSFDYYDGPVKGYLHKWCYLCGRESTKALFTTKSGAAPIGACENCFEKRVKKYAARARKEGYSLFVAEIKVKDKYEAAQ